VIDILRVNLSDPLNQGVPIPTYQHSADLVASDQVGLPALCASFLFAMCVVVRSLN
jgi:hypothetical protein